MKNPALDNRTTEKILEQMRRRAASYTPEWRFDDDPSDPGVALAKVFSEMYTHTLDRFNALPQKYYTEYLNMLGVSAPDVQPAACYVRFHVHENADHAAVIPEHTLIAANDERSNSSVIYEVESRIEATPAKLESIFFYDADRSLLQKLDLSVPGHVLFGPDDSENLSVHELRISSNEVLAAEGSCSFRVEIRQKVQFRNQALAELLGNEKEAEWHWFDGENWTAFDEVSVSGSILVLHKLDPRPLLPNEDGRLMIRCRLFHPAGAIEISEILLSSAPDEMLPMEEMWDDDLPLEDGRGYCFGRRPGIYSLFYLRSDRVFCKRGSNVAVKMEIGTEIEDPEGGAVIYDWSQHVINKDETAPIQPDDVVISRIIWEYYNGNGWAMLPVQGDANPFVPADKGKVRVLTFRVPDNLEITSVNAQDGYYIRARIAAIDNLYSQHQRWMLPYMTKASCIWQYESGRPCTYAASVNDGTKYEIAEADSISNLQLRAFFPTQAQGRCLFFRFDRSPDAMPLSMWLQIRRGSFLPVKVCFEALRGGRYYPIPTTDGTGNFFTSGLISLYLSEQLTTECLFGEEGCWIRATCEAAKFDECYLPKIDAVDINVTGAVQRQQAENQFFDTEAYAKNKQISLLQIPVLKAEVWIDETGHLTEAQMQMMRAEPGKLREEADSNEAVRYWVRWDRISDLRLAGGSDRVFELDSAEGVIRFGDDRHGHILPEGSNNILVKYAFGGGPAGNQPVGSINTIINSIPMVDEVVNLTTACGGQESGNRVWLDRIGTYRLRHRNRAVSQEDYEKIILENFPRVSKVKCYCGYNLMAEPEPGYISIVFLCNDATNSADTENLAHEIYCFLTEHCDCTAASSNRLAVTPALEMSISVEAQLELKNLNIAADTQKEISDSISSLIDNVWRPRGIGETLHTEELYKLLSQAPNVAVVRNLLIRGTWNVFGQEYSCNLEEDHDFPYYAFHSGRHQIYVM